MSQAADQRRYVDMMALSTYQALWTAQDPIGILKVTIEHVLADQRGAIEAAIALKLPAEARGWFERKGRRLLQGERPTFVLPAGTIAPTSQGFAVIPQPQVVQEGENGEVQL
jgi:hypothetical protein